MFNPLCTFWKATIMKYSNQVGNIQQSYCIRIKTLNVYLKLFLFNCIVLRDVLIFTSIFMLGKKCNVCCGALINIHLSIYNR